MKLAPGEQERSKLFSATKFSADGFIGNDPRLIDEIIAHDAQTLESLQMTSEAIATLLEDAFCKAEGAFGDTIELKPGVTALFFESRGKIPSPFRGDGFFQKGEVAIHEVATGNEFYITRLGIDLIRKHTFFQGRGTRFRLEPEQILRLLA